MRKEKNQHCLVEDGGYNDPQLVKEVEKNMRTAKQMKNINEKIKVGIDIVNRKAMALKKDDWPKLSDQLRDLRKYIHDLEYWIDGEIRTQIEVLAKQKAQAIIDAGFTFDSVVINKIRFTTDNGKTANKYQDSEIPF